MCAWQQGTEGLCSRIACSPPLSDSFQCSAARSFDNLDAVRDKLVPAFLRGIASHNTAHGHVLTVLYSPSLPSAACSSDNPDAVRDKLVPAFLRGIASHHAGCLPAWKSLVERCFQKGLLKLVYATGAHMFDQGLTRCLTMLDRTLSGCFLVVVCCRVCSWVYATIDYCILLCLFLPLNTHGCRSRMLQRQPLVCVPQPPSPCVVVLQARLPLAFVCLLFAAPQHHLQRMHRVVVLQAR